MKPETLTLHAPEVRFSTSDEGTFNGYAAVFNEPNSFGEIVERGAFKKTLREHAGRNQIPMFWSHNSDEPIGVWSDLSEDDRGLKVAGKLITETTRGRDAHALLKAGAVNGLSIGFRTRSAKRGPNGARILTDIELVEISLVSLPAASKARVTTVRSAARAVSTAAFVSAVRRAAQALTTR